MTPEELDELLASNSYDAGVENARILADGLEFPEGPVALPDGDLLVVEVRGGRLTRIAPDGAKTTVAEVPGGPNGAAIGPDGAVYVCNRGAVDGHLAPGRVQRVDLVTGVVEDLYTECDGVELVCPNDLVFDDTGGFWFTDIGLDRPRRYDWGGLYYAQPDGSSITEVVHGFGPNGVGLSPDGRTVYAAETMTARLWSWALSAPGVIAAERTLVAGVGGCAYQRFDSLAVEAGGNVCVGTLEHGGITVVTPTGTTEHLPVPEEIFVTNICFGGDDLRTAYVTLSTTGKVLVCDWPRPGLRLAFG